MKYYEENLPTKIDNLKTAFTHSVHTLTLEFVLRAQITTR